MSLESSTDPQLAAFLALGAAAANADLLATLGETAVKKTYTHPDALKLAASLELPALSMHRAGPKRYIRHGVLYVDALQTWTVEYIAPSVHPERLNELWPLLDNVWNKIFASFLAGRHASHAAGVFVMAAVNVIGLDPRTAVKQERYGLVGDDQAFPAFLATFVAKERTNPDDISADQPFLGADFDFDLQNAGVPEIPAHVRVSTDHAAFSAGGDPLIFDVANVIEQLDARVGVGHGGLGLAESMIGRKGIYAPVQATLGTRPAYVVAHADYNGHPAIDHVSDDRIVDTTIPALTLPCAVFLTARITDLASTRFLFAIGSGAPIAFAWVVGSGFRIQAGGASLATGTGFSSTAKHAWCLVFDAAAAAIYRAEQNTGDFTTPLATGPLAADSETGPLTVGSLDASGILPWVGSWTTMIFRSGMPDSGMRARYLQYVRERGDL